MPDTNSTRALQLRVQALALLEQAQALDGLKPFLVTHGFDEGQSNYLVWHYEPPREALCERVLDTEFEPDREEWLAVDESLTLPELAGTSPTCRMPDIVEEQHAMNRRIDASYLASREAPR